MAAKWRPDYTSTRDGVPAEVAASASNVQDVRLALENGASSIGLLRSEGLYTGAGGAPCEDTLYAFYREILELAAPRRVVARICDFGGKNRPDFLCLAPEDNPQMGFRSIRVLLSRPEVFLPQLRALLRASVHGNLSILMPMVSTVDEVLRTRALLDEARAQLAAQGAAVSPGIELGAMVETPAAAIVSDMLARYVDFFYIGVHTLAQYTLVTEHSRLMLSEEVCSTSVLRLIRGVAEQALQHRVRMGVIGDSAANPHLVVPLLALGVTTFSVVPEQLAQTRELVRCANIAAQREALLERLSHRA